MNSHFQIHRSTPGNRFDINSDFSATESECYQVLFLKKSARILKNFSMQCSLHRQPETKFFLPTAVKCDPGTIVSQENSLSTCKFGN